MSDLALTHVNSAARSTPHQPRPEVPYRPCMSDVGLSDRSDPDILNGLLRSTPSHRAIVVGAGFSKAVSSLMPINDQLGDRAVAIAGLADVPRFEGGRFETWLSRLAEPQPDLTPAGNALNQARFLAIADAIHQVIIESEQAACASAMPPWLGAFVTTAHLDQSVIITFNYDTLVESAVQRSRLGVPARSGYIDPQQTLHWMQVYAGVPPAPPTWYATSEVPTLRLLKLHGSAHWYWVTGDETGATLHHAQLENTPEERRREHPGRQPFIVPPAALKSSYFRNPVVSQIWSDAAAAVRRAAHLDLVGYSLPLTDLTAAGMLADSIRTETALTVANPDHDGSVSANVRRVFGRDPATVRGAEEYVADFVAERSLQLVHDLRASRDVLATNALVQVGWSRQEMAAATRVDPHGDRVDVHVAAFTDRDNRPIVAPDTQHSVRLQELTTGSSSAHRIEAVFDDGSRSPIVGIERFGTEAGLSNKWQLLIPAYRPGELRH